jgi:hypothetical protein
MSWLAFILQVLPVTGMALLATVVGTAIPVSGAMRIPLLLIGVLLFAGLLTFRKTRGWNLALLLGLAAAAGALINTGTEVRGGPSWTGAIILMIALMALAAFIGKALHGRLRRTGLVTWVLACVYVAGWLPGGLLNPADWLRIIWAIAGLVIFSGLATVWFSRLESEEIPPRGLSFQQGCDLYLLGLNIAVAGQVLLTSLTIT